MQAILCTSANGVRALARLTGERGLAALAVGDATASRARAEGFTNVASAGGGCRRSRPPRGRDGFARRSGRLLHVAGDVVAGDLVGALREQGFTIERSVLYDARPVAALSESRCALCAAAMIDFALFFSPRTATIFVGLATCAELAVLRKITALSISPAADAALSELPWRNRLVADRPNQAALIDQLDVVLGERRRG